MGFTISIQPVGKIIQAEDGETILAAALRHGVNLPYGCREGSCGSCRGRVLHGIVDHGSVPDFLLSQEDRQSGFALFCSARACSDLSIERATTPPAADISARTLPARVLKLTRAAPDVMLLELRIPSSERFDFLAGQYIEILLKDGQRRAFSLAMAPEAGAPLQLHIRHIPGGLFTDHVFNGLKERDMLRIHGPLGNFFLREDSEKPVLLVVGGTGFAPIKAIVECALTRKLKLPMHIYRGARREGDLYLGELAEHWSAVHPHIRYVPVLSDTPPDTVWEGRTGLVHHSVLEDFPDLSGHRVYVCGSPAMVEAARCDFIRRGRLPEDAFFADIFALAAKPDTVTPNSSFLSG